MNVKEEIKVIIHSGIIEAVLMKEGEDSCPGVEIIDIDPDYDDYYEALNYSQELYRDSSYKEIPFSIYRDC